MTNKEIVKSKFKKAWCENMCRGDIKEFWINDGILPDDCNYFPFAFSEPAGKKIAEGDSIRQAWANAALQI